MTRKVNTAFSIACTVLLPFMATADAAPLVITECGKAAEFAIVIPDKASPCQRYAAEELRDFTEKATGVKLPIVTDVDPMPTKAVKLEVVSPKSKGEGGTDGFRIKVDGGLLRIVGENERGVLYGVYEVLERFVGCRWYSSWRSVVPRRERIEVPGDQGRISRQDKVYPC